MVQLVLISTLRDGCNKNLHKWKSVSQSTDPEQYVESGAMFPIYMKRTLCISRRTYGNTPINFVKATNTVQIAHAALSHYPYGQVYYTIRALSNREFRTLTVDIVLLIKTISVKLVKIYSICL